MTAPLDPGLLRARLVLEAEILAPDGAGGTLRSFQPRDMVWAQVTPLGPASREGTAASHRILVRYRDDLRPGMRLRSGARSFEVTAVHDPDETRRFLEARCIETV